MQKRPRSLFAGCTDYTGVGVDVIVDHLKDWRATTSETIGHLRTYRSRVDASSNSFDSPRDIRDYIDGCIDLFTRYISDFDRIIEELPRQVLARHVTTVEQIYESSVLEENRCVRFASEHVNTGLREEVVRPVLEAIYASSRDQIIDYKDLSNVAYRLRALVESANEPDRRATSAIDALELKPNFFGVGINLNHIFKVIARRFRRR